MKLQLLDEAFNEELDYKVIKKNIAKVLFFCFLLMLLIRYFVRGYILENLAYFLDLLGVMTIAQGILLTSGMAIYTHVNNFKRWTFGQVLFYMIGITCFLTVLRAFIFGVLGGLLLVLLGIELKSEEQQLFFQEHFWMDILPLLTDVVLVYYLFNPIDKIVRPVNK